MVPSIDHRAAGPVQAEFTTWTSGKITLSTTNGDEGSVRCPELQTRNPEHTSHPRRNTSTFRLEAWWTTTARIRRSHKRKSANPTSRVLYPPRCVTTLARVLTYVRTCTPTSANEHVHDRLLIRRSNRSLLSIADALSTSALQSEMDIAAEGRDREKGTERMRGKVIDGEHRCLCLRTDSGSRSN